jgi:hypothetical protein
VSAVRPKWPKLTKEIIEGFASSCLTPYFDEASAFADFHRELWDLCCSDDRFVAIEAPRGHAKSTIITIVYTLAVLLFRERRYVVSLLLIQNLKQLYL